MLRIPRLRPPRPRGASRGSLCTAGAAQLSLRACGPSRTVADNPHVRALIRKTPGTTPSIDKRQRLPGINIVSEIQKLPCDRGLNRLGKRHGRGAYAGRALKRCRAWSRRAPLSLRRCSLAQSARLLTPEEPCQGIGHSPRPQVQRRTVAPAKPLPISSMSKITRVAVWHHLKPR
jgi:hypothetical protein